MFSSTFSISRDSSSARRKSCRCVFKVVNEVSAGACGVKSMGAIRNIFCIWYESGMKMSAEKMAEFGTRLALHGIYSPDN